MQPGAQVILRKSHGIQSWLTGRHATQYISEYRENPLFKFFFLSVNIKDQKYLVLTAERATSKPDPSHGEESICTGCDHQAWTVQI